MTNSAILSAIEQELVHVESYLAALREKVHALQTTFAAVAPSPGSEAFGLPEIPVQLTRNGPVHPAGFWYKGEFHSCASQIGIYIGVLRAIAQNSDDALPRAAAALRDVGHSRRYLAADHRQLFESQTEDWARAHSRRIVDGWYADTNLGLERKKQLLRRILRAIGLKEGTDVVILWKRTPANGASIARLIECQNASRH